ncbi:MAG TPA: MBL fold metallo-hydrolase [Planctomycetota bacterium]
MAAGAPPLREVQVGRFRVRALRDADLWLDGGAMFGVVPRPVWEPLAPPDARHRVRLATTPYLVEDGATITVIEPGIGRRWNAKERDRYRIESDGGRDLLASLAAAGVAPAAVDHVLMTHAHWDHLGAAVGADGAPVFPNATHWLPETELRAALDPDALRRASYRHEDVQPLQAAGLLRTFGSEGCEPLPGVRMHPVGGHSDAVCLVTLADRGATACFWADVLPTRHHAPLAWIMAYDQNAERSFAVRNEWIPRAAAEGWTCLLYHDAETPIGRLVAAGRNYAFQALAAD